MKFKLVWVTINGYCLSWLLPVSDLDQGILGKKLHGIKWIFLNYKAYNSSGSKYQLSVSSQPARKKMVGLENKRPTTFILQSQMPLVLIKLEEEAADPDQLSLVSKLNGCRLQWCKTWALAPGFNLKWQKYKYFQPILFCNFPLWSLHNSQVTIHDNSWPMRRLAWEHSLGRFSKWPIFPFLHTLTPHPRKVSLCNVASHK